MKITVNAANVMLSGRHKYIHDPILMLLPETDVSATTFA